MQENALQHFRELPNLWQFLHQIFREISLSQDLPSGLTMMLMIMLRLTSFLRCQLVGSAARLFSPWYSLIDIFFRKVIWLVRFDFQRFETAH